MWPRCALRVILNGECRAIFETNTFYRIIIQVDMCDLHVWRLFDRFRINSKTMILRGNLAPASDDILHWVIQPAMAMVHFKCRNIIGECHQLMAQADTEGRFLFI